jgi:hypothetical protein
MLGIMRKKRKDKCCKVEILRAIKGSHCERTMGNWMEDSLFGLDRSKVSSASGACCQVVDTNVSS